MSGVYPGGNGYAGGPERFPWIPSGPPYFDGAGAVPPGPRVPATDTPPNPAYPPALPGPRPPTRGYPILTYNPISVPPPHPSVRPGREGSSYPHLFPYPPRQLPQTECMPYRGPYPPKAAGHSECTPHDVRYPPVPGGQPDYAQAAPSVAAKYPKVYVGHAGAPEVDDPERRPQNGAYGSNLVPVSVPGSGPPQVAQLPSPQGHLVQTRPAGPRKRALVIGCNYANTVAELKGCITDATYIIHMLQTQFSFLDENIRMMTDDQQGALCPTKSNIFLGFQWLLQGAQAGDKLFLHFSGHGSQQKDQDGDEKDGADETLLPTDYRDAGHILDDEVNERVVNPLPEGVVLHSVIDACHSGTAMDLRYYTKCKRGTFEWKDNYKSPHLARTKGTAGGVAFQFGACKDSEVAQDTAELGGTNSGAATYSFIQAIEFGGRSQSYGQILCRMQRSMDKLKKLREDSAAGGGAGGQLGRWMEKVAAQKQTPQLSCSSKIDLSQPLML